MTELINLKLRRKIDDYRRKGGKKSRRATAERIERFIIFSDVVAHKIGKRHVHEFYESHDFSATTMRDYFYAISKLWLMLGRGNPPPRPKHKTNP